MLNLYPTTLLILGGVLHSTTSLPLYHRAAASVSNFNGMMQTATSGTYQHFLESNGVAATTFHPVPVQRLGAPSPANAPAINQAIYNAVDRIPPSNVSFSDQYRHFWVENEAVIPVDAIRYGISSMPIPNGTLIPLYGLPSLGTTLNKWQSQTTTASWTTPITPTETNITISFGGIQLIDVQRGGWFNKFDGVKAVETSNATSWSKYFGTAQSPGPASTYVDKVLLVYKPSANISDSNSASLPSNAGQVNGGLWGPDISEPSETQDGLVFSPKTEDAYIVGVVTRSYWDAA
ncbi:hypothetical protein C8R46DRAFT_1244142 [Mycena filopes]|nr:hypothetical protein C8R46DRAFT_1244142 [Mycena filopes]